MNYVENILAAYEMATHEEVLFGMNWYAIARGEAQAIADECELPLGVVVGVIAALSPTNNWAQNIKDASAFCKTFVDGGYFEDVKASTYKAMWQKAWTILSDTPADLMHIAQLLKGPKITDFFWCIMGFDTCVIDGHAWGIANADRRIMQEVPSIGKKLRQELQEAYAVAGHKHNITAYQMQAITWVAWRRIHGIK